MNTKNLLFKDFADALDYWKSTAAECLTNEDSDLIWTDNPNNFQRIARVLSAQGIAKEELETALEEVVRGFCVSVLTTLDGGTSLSESTKLELRDHAGNELTGLREDFVSYLFDTGRLK